MPRSSGASHLQKCLWFLASLGRLNLATSRVSWRVLPSLFGTVLFSLLENQARLHLSRIRWLILMFGPLPILGSSWALSAWFRSEPWELSRNEIVPLLAAKPTAGRP